MQKKGQLPGSVEEYHLKILAIRPPIDWIGGSDLPLALLLFYVLLHLHPCSYNISTLLLKHSPLWQNSCFWCFLLSILFKTNDFVACCVLSKIRASDLANISLSPGYLSIHSRIQILNSSRPTTQGHSLLKAPWIYGTTPPHSFFNLDVSFLPPLNKQTQSYMEIQMNSLFSEK